MTGAQLAVGQEMLDRRGQPEQPQRVRDRRSALAHPIRQLLVREVEVLDQLLVCGAMGFVTPA